MVEPFRVIERAIAAGPMPGAAAAVDDRTACFGVTEPGGPAVTPDTWYDLGAYEFKLARVHGDFVWHNHADTDEVFLIIDGEMTIEFRDRRTTLEAGEFCVVPCGVEHRTMADTEAEVLVFEPAHTRNTGNIVDETFTAPNGVVI